MDNAATTCKFLGETWGFWIQTGALFLSALGAIWIIHSREQSERRRATIDLVIHQKADPNLQKAKLHILGLHENHVQNFAQYLQDRNSDDCKNILLLLNNYEFIAAGIRESALDEDIYKRVQYSVLVKDWDALSGFVMEFRRIEERPTLFQEFEYLAKRWKKNKLKIDDGTAS
jgi:hypothetical protein